ncbi:MAG: cell division protein FtsZ [bacterium]|nr:cell division protein FtsZ [bacterium]
MPKLNPEVEAFARIKVVGIGGAGGNALNHMVNSKVRGIEFLAMNTDTQDLHSSLGSKKIHLGKNLTKGLGAGMDPDIGKRSAEEARGEIEDALKGADMAFITAGMGGGTGTGAAPTIARIAKEQGILTVGVVTKPFFFEGSQRMKIAERGLEELEKEVDALIVIPNDRLLSVIEKGTTLKSAFAACDEVLRQAVEGISELITVPGIINVDFADIKAVISDTGPALIGIGRATGDSRATEAAVAAINSPLLDISIQGAKGLLFVIAGDENMSMHEVQDAAKVVTESVDKDAKVIFGAIRDERLKKGEIKLTVVASGFPANSPRKSLFQLGGTPAREERREEKKEVHAPPSEAVKKPAEKKERELVLDDVGESEEWNAIPAFLRRGKK